MCRLDRRFPGFAGAVIQTEGNSLLLLFARPRPSVDPRKVKAALSELGFGVNGRPVIRPVRYSFCQLKKWHDKLSEDVLKWRGAVSSDIDERRNELVIGVVEKNKWAPKVEAAARRLAIPLDAVRIRKAEMIDIHG